MSAEESTFSPDELYAMVKPNLDKVVAPIRRRIQEVDEKLVRRTSLLAELMKAQDEGTIPKAIVVPRMPQCPKSQEEEFREKMKAISEDYAKKTLTLLMDVRTKDAKELHQDRKVLFAEAREKVQEALFYAYTVIDMVTKEVSKHFEDKYMDWLADTMERSKLKAEVSQSIGSYVESEKKSADLLKKAAAEADEEVAPDAQGVDRLRKEIQSLKRDIRALKTAQKKPNKNPDKPNAKGKQGKAPKTKGKPKGRSKNGKPGAAGRGAKRN